MKKIIGIFLGLVFTLAFSSCDAPRLNPLDSQNPNNKLGQIDGYILSSSRVPLTGVKIIWKNQNVFVTTDSKGYYKIENLQMKNGMLIFEKEGLARDSFYVEWNNQKIKHLQEIILSYIRGQFDGYVFTIPREAVSNVKVLWRNQNIFTETNSDGYYKLENVSMNDGWIYFEKEGLSKDSFYVQWNNEEVKHITDIILYPTIGSLDGYVYASPHSALSQVMVLWKNQNILAETNSSGYYKLENISMKDGWLYFEKDGFTRDSVYITWNNQKEIHVSEVILNYTRGQLDGYVYVVPRQPLQNVKVLWKNQNILVQTNNGGYYKLENISMKDGWLYFEKDGFTEDSVYVTWNNQSSIRIKDIILNYTRGQIDGYVFAVPKQPLSNVKVFWKNQNIVVETSSSGYYKLESISIKDGWLYFEKFGFKKDSVYITWNNQNSIRVSDRILSYTSAQLYGYVKTVALPRKPISNVKVFWKNQSIITETDANGFYQFNNVSQNNGWLYFEKDGYSKDSVYVQFDNAAAKQVEDRFLNANPRLLNLSLYTIVQNRYPDIQVQRLIVQASIADDENDVDSVFVKNYSLNFVKRLVFNPETNRYENSFRTVDIKINSLEDAIGTDFIIVAKDKSGRTFSIGSSSIKRIINQEITIVSPVNREVVGNKPTFKWNKFTPGFSFEYMVQVYTDETSPILMWEKKNISKDLVETVCDTSLPAGDYYWVIWSIDSFGNSSISKPGTFTVK